MSDNRFKDCETAEAVLMKFWRALPVALAYELRPDALARIAELQPRTVDEAGRERAREVTYDWWLNTTGMSRANADQLVDRIIDALGWTAAEPEPVAPVSNRVAVTKKEWERAVNAASEHHFVDHQSAFGDKCFCGWTSHEVPHAEHQINYVLDALDCMGLVIHEPAPVADAPHQCADVADDCCERTPATPAVELDCDGLLRLASGLNDIEVLTGIRLSVQVLRIGGDQ